MQAFDEPVFLTEVKPEFQTYFERLMDTSQKSERFPPTCTHTNLRRDKES